MAKTTPRQPAQAIDVGRLLQMLQLAGEHLPGLLTFLSQLAGLLQSRQQAAASARVANAHAHGCCAKALEHACITVAELLACQECCDPDHAAGAGQGPGAAESPR